VLPSANRLRRSADFTRVVREGRRSSCTTLVLHTLPTDPSEPTRIGFVVSRSVGSAAVRNRVKRRLRHLARPLVETPGRAIVLRATPAAADADSARLARDLERCLARAER
jgi:ribonuclease P protein component